MQHNTNEDQSAIMAGALLVVFIATFAPMPNVTMAAALWFSSCIALIVSRFKNIR